MGRPRKFVDTPYAGDAGEVVAAVATEPDAERVARLVNEAAEKSKLPMLLAFAKQVGDQPMIDAILARCSQ